MERQQREGSVLAAVQDILDELHGGICITDGVGIILQLGKSCLDLYGIGDAYIGKNIAVLEEEGVFSPCLTLIAIRKGQSVCMPQPDKNGNALLVTAAPIFAPGTRQIVYTVSYASWDIKSALDLRQRHEQMTRATRHSYMERDALKPSLPDIDLVAESAPMRQLAQLAEKVANVDVAVLITGDPGAGKSNFAKYIHTLSARQNQPYGYMSCSAFSDEILESELFGGESVNSKTGEPVEKAGLCEALHMGTLLLEDIEDVGRRTQSKLLHMLKHKQFYRKNRAYAVPADVRLIATTRKEPAQLAEYLDPDFFYRLTVVTVDMPPLKNRKEDIPRLAAGFLEQYSERYHKDLSIHPAAMGLLEMHHWPGNITELKCLIQQLALSVEAPAIQAHHLPDNLSPYASSHFAAVVDLKEYMEYYEKRLVLQAYNMCKTTVKLAKYLGISQASAVRKLQKYRNK